MNTPKFLDDQVYECTIFQTSGILYARGKFPNAGPHTGDRLHLSTSYSLTTHRVGQREPVCQNC